MPTYEFACRKCKKSFDVTRPMSKAGAPAKCPKCKRVAQRLFSAAIITTGTGGSDFDMDEDFMPDFDGGGDHGHDHGMPGMGGMPGMDDLGF